MPRSEPTQPFSPAGRVSLRSPPPDGQLATRARRRHRPRRDPRPLDHLRRPPFSPPPSTHPPFSTPPPCSLPSTPPGTSRRRRLPARGTPPPSPTCNGYQPPTPPPPSCTFTRRKLNTRRSEPLARPRG